MTDTTTRAAESVVRNYEETQRLLTLAGGVPQPIGQSPDHAVVLALAHLSAQRPAEATDTNRLRDIADFMDDYGFGRGDTNDGPHVRAAADELDRLRGRVAEYGMGPKEAAEWKAFGAACLRAMGRADRDTPTAEDVAYIAALKAGDELYARGYALIGACDISNYLALCQIAGHIGEPVLHDLALKMDAEREYREAGQCSPSAN